MKTYGGAGSGCSPEYFIKKMFLGSSGGAVIIKSQKITNCAVNAATQSPKTAAAQEMERVKAEVGIHLHLVASKETKVAHFN